MIAGLDSSFFRPSVAQLQAARAAGVRIWAGYLATRGGVGLASPWDRASFDRVRSILGTTPIAWASGWDDPAACRRLADAWSVRLGLDVEGGGLRPDGSWVQGWLDAAGRDRTGLYGNTWVFTHGYRAAFYVIAGYPGRDPGATWGYVVPPGGPCGWQWQGSHDEFGGSVDRGWYDDWFLQGDDMFDQPDRDKLDRIFQILTATDAAKDDAGNPIDDHWAAGYSLSHIRTIEAKLAALAVPTVDVQALTVALTGPLSAALAPHLPPTVDPAAVAKDVLAGMGKALGSA